ncbi:hypothetical protein FS837_005299 [Tulasnella sp. UAMH 9824]|nr:hypothetical protein FS837_005299 [Tulasnella sp. UAMH 9824]
MSSSGGTPQTDYSSYTKHEPGCIPKLNLFDAFPDEVIIYVLSFPPLLAVVRFASTSRRHKFIASAEQIWFPVVLGILKDNVDPNDTLVDEGFMRRNRNRFLAALGLSAPDTTYAWYRIATKLLERIEWTLGWWLGKADGFAKGCLWRIFIEIDEADPGGREHDERFFRVLATQVGVVENDGYSLLLPPGGPRSTRVGSAGGFSTLRLYGQDRWSYIAVHGFRPLSPRLKSRGFLSGYLSLANHNPPDDAPPSYSARKLQDHFPHLPLKIGDWKTIAERKWGDTFSDAPYPPPLLSQLLGHRSQQVGDSPLVPSIALLPMNDPETATQTLLSVRRPSSLSKHPNELVHTGIYVAPYSVHGWEYLLVRVRKLTEDDFQVTWPWEGSMAVAPSDAIQTTDEPDWESPHSHLGPFSGIIPTDPISSDPLRVSRGHVREGCRVLEGIKIMGDDNVPGGQRSFIAFLDDPLIQPEALQEAEEGFLDMLPEREDELPWPFVSQAPPMTENIDNAAYKQIFFSPERGIDIPGVIRLANTSFSVPQWTNCVLHVECKTKFTVAAFGAKAIVFRKLNDWGV